MKTSPSEAQMRADGTGLPGRHEALVLLAKSLPGMSQIRTQLHGVTGVWQPADYLPDFAQPDVHERIDDIRKRAAGLPRDLLYALAGNVLTEEGLPLFAVQLESIDVPKHGPEAEEAARLKEWFRMWAGEENRHGDLLTGYLTYSGRFDMKAFQASTQQFLQDGIDVQTGSDAFEGFAYTSFQELATQRAHMNVARLANENGDPFLAKICGQVAADEGYHAKAYIDFVRQFFATHPNEMMKALNSMLRKGIVMPAHNMREAKRVDDSLILAEPGMTYEYFSNLSQQLGLYTAQDYAEISAQLLRTWKLAQPNAGNWEVLPVEGLNPEGADAQQGIVRRHRMAEKMAVRRQKIQPVPAPGNGWVLKP